MIKQKKKGKRILLAVAIVFIVILAGSAAMLIYLSQGLNDMAEREIVKADASHLANGSYEGHFEKGRWSNELVVHVKNQTIAQIEIVRTVRFERPEVTETLINRILAAQSTDVDVVSSATLTCQSYLEAMADALTGAQPSK